MNWHQTNTEKYEQRLRDEFDPATGELLMVKYGSVKADLENSTYGMQFEGVATLDVTDALKRNNPYFHRGTAGCGASNCYICQS